MHERVLGNILGSGTNVLIQSSDPDSSIVASANAVNTYYNGLGSVTSTLDTTEAPITAGLLAGRDLFISMLPSDSYAASEIAALDSFLAASGTLFFMGEAEIVRPAQNASINAALSELGSSMILGDSTFIAYESPGSNVVPEPSSLTVFGVMALGMAGMGIRRRKSNPTA